MSNHPKRGLAVTHCRPNPEVSYRLRYTYSFQNCVPAPVGTEYNGVQNRIGVFLLPRVPLCYALPGLVPVLSSSPVQLREGFPKGRAFPPTLVPRPSSPVPGRGVPKGKAPKRRRGRIKRGAFEETARLAAHQGRESYSHDGVRATALALCAVGGPGRSRNALVLFFRGVGRVLFQKRMRPTSLRWEPPPLREQESAKGHPGSAAYSCTGGRPGPGSARRWGWRGCGCLLLPRSGW